MIDTIRTADVRWLAGLDSIWPEGIEMLDGILIARVHPRNNRPAGDETVICRALVLTRDGMHRLTIRTTNIVPRDPDPATPESTFMAEYAQMYRVLLDAVMKLPVIELPA
jgi:hypothetical protein